MSTIAEGAGGHVRTRREWIVLAVGAVVVAALCLVAGKWQWNRHLARSAKIDIVVSNYDADPVPLQDLVAEPGATLPPEDAWHPVRMSGTYLPQDTVLLRNRPVDSTAGFHVLVPFELDGADLVLIVDRGFVPMGDDSSGPDFVPDPPEGLVELTARLRPDESPSSRGAPSGQVQSITTQQILDTAPSGGSWAQGRTTEVYGALISENPAPARGLRGLPAPSTEVGTHLSYTFQWIVFAVGAIGGFMILLRRERREAIRQRTEALAPAQIPLDTPADIAAWIVGVQAAEDPARAPRRTSDEDAEDAQLDAQGFF